MKRIKKTVLKLFLFILVTSLIPIAIFGSISIIKSGQSTLTIISEGNYNITIQIKDRIEQYLSGTKTILLTLAELLSNSGLSERQRDQILRNYATNFEEFHFFRVVDTSGHIISTSELDTAPIDYAADSYFQKALTDNNVMSDVFLSKSLIPAIRFYIPIKQNNSLDHLLIGEVDLLNLWKHIQNIRIGDNGHVSLTDGSGHIFASGDGKLKIKAINMSPYPYFDQLKKNKNQKYLTTDKELISYSQLEGPPSWYVIIQQPLQEAYKPRSKLIQTLLVLILALILIIIVLSWKIGDKHIVLPISQLLNHIRQLSTGDLQARINIQSGEEFQALGNTINEMADKILIREAELVKKETQAVLGRLAKGLAHDIKHPFTTIEMFTKALEYKHNDEEFIKNFISVVKNEFTNIHVFLDNLSQLSKDIPHSPIKLNLSEFIEQQFEKLKITYANSGVDFHYKIQPNLWAFVDIFNMQRCLNNLTRNALEAMPNGGILTLALAKEIKNERAYGVIMINDNGKGMPIEQVNNLFSNYESTKKNGLGIGLAMTHKIIAQHGGYIEVTSKTDKGSTFYLFIPITQSQGDLT